MKHYFAMHELSSMMDASSAGLCLNTAANSVQLHVLGGQTAREVPGLGLLGVLGLAVAHHTVLVSLAGEEDAPVVALGDVAGLHHLPELLALAQLGLGLEHALLVVV